MKKSLVILASLSLFLLYACGNATDKLAGNWAGDADATLALQGTDTNDPGYSMVRSMTEAMMKQIRLSIDPAKSTLSFSMGKNSHSGSYTLASEQDGILTLQMEGREPLLFKLDKDSSGREILLMLDAGTREAQFAFSRAQ